MVLSDAQIEAIDEIATDLLNWIFEVHGRGVLFLSDAQRAHVSSVMDTMEPGERRYHAVLDIVQDTVDNEAARQYFAEED